MFRLGYLQFVVGICSLVVGSTLLGGWSGTEKANTEVQTLLQKAKPKIEAAANEKYDKLEAISYRKQLVNGMNYLIKAKVQNEGSQKDKYIHVKMWKSFNNHVDVVRVEKNKSENDVLSI